MFFSVFNYYTKPNKIKSLNRSETKNIIKKIKIKNPLGSMHICGDKKMETKNFSALFAPLR
jgi:hypothetical protein